MPTGLGDEQLWVSPTLTLDDISDITGNGNTALYDGTVTVVEDPAGYEGFQTSNTTAGTDYVYFDAPTAVDLPSASIAFWATSSFLASYAPIGGFCTAAFNDLRFFISRRATSGLARVYRKTVGGSVAIDDFLMPNGSADFTGGEWHHWCLVFENGKNNLYFDGVLIGQSPTSATGDLDVSGTNFSLGSQDGRTTAASAARYDDIRFYDSALTAAEVVHLASLRGVEGLPPVGLGDEQLWLCPSLNDSANDITGNGNHGTYQNGMGTISDTSNGGSLAYEFDGTDDYIDVVSSSVPAASYSVSLWQKNTRSNNQISIVFNAGDSSNNRVVNVDGYRSGTSGDNHGHRSSGTNYWVEQTTIRNQSQWYHYLLTYDGSFLRIYVDGQWVNTRSGVPNTTYTETKCWIGQYIGGGFHFQGQIDDIRTYDRALIQAEITHLASSRGVEGPSGGAGPSGGGLLLLGVG